MTDPVWWFFLIWLPDYFKKTRGLDIKKSWVHLVTSASDMFPRRAVASVVGLGGMAGSIGGILFPLYSGKLLDRFQAAGNVTAGYTVLFMICGSAYLVAFAINHLLAPRFQPLELAE